MRAFDFSLNTARLTALPSGALWWSERALLCVSDLHFGKSHRLARRGGQMLPPYETRETLGRLEADILRLNPLTIVCLGDSFDDLAAFEEMDRADHLWLACLMAGRQWIWIEGNHDPGPVDIAGTHVSRYSLGPLVFRHIAEPGAVGEISGHYHPKTRVKTKGRSLSRPCFLLDTQRLILPAYGTYTGGLLSDANPLQDVMQANALAILTGTKAMAVPMNG